jgi:hypothetical protein
LQAHHPGVLLIGDHALVVGSRAEALLGVVCDLLHRLDRLNALRVVEYRAPVFVEPAIAEGVEVPVRLVDGGVHRLQATDIA